MAILDTIEQQIETLQEEVKSAKTAVPASTTTAVPAAAPTPGVTATPTVTSAVTSVPAPAGNVSPIIQMAIDQAAARYAREGGK